jgi:hypothetical protein
MDKWIANYVKGCATCQQNKILTHCKKTPSNSHPFQQVIMDLIIGLPTQNGKDAILIIMDHGCSQAAIFLVTAKDCSNLEDSHSL